MENITEILNNLMQLEKQKHIILLQLIAQNYHINEKNTYKCIDEKLFLPLDSLFENEHRIKNSLKSEGFFYVGDIVCHPNLYCNSLKIKHDFNSLLRCQNIGRKSFAIIIESLIKLGFYSHIRVTNYEEIRDDICKPQLGSCDKIYLWPIKKETMKECE